MQGRVPVPGGAIEIYCSPMQIKIKSPVGGGLLHLKSSVMPSGKNISASKTGDVYEIKLDKNIEYLINYKAI